MAVIYFRYRYIFLIGFLLGISLPFLTFLTSGDYHDDFVTLAMKYEKWFRDKNLYRTAVAMDDLRYGYKQYFTESQFLYQQANVICVVLVRKEQNAQAIKNTWGKNCNEILFYSHLNLKNTSNVQIINYKVKSSWHLLCEVIRLLSTKTFMWAFFVNDDTFAILDNLRLLLAPLKGTSQYYYFGHSIRFWGVTFNVPEAGYVLNHESISHLVTIFNTTESCILGGKFWKQEAFYLGKHLRNFNITPFDTRDDVGLSTFHGYSLQQLLFPGSTSLANYYKYSVYPVQCCSKHSVTFQANEADKMYLYYFLLYSFQIFVQGDKGNKQAPIPHELVWRKFLREEGVEADDISAERYYNLWKNKVADPAVFNEHIRNSITLKSFTEDIVVPNVFQNLIKSSH